MERPSIMTSYADLNETSSSLGAVLGIVLVCVKCLPDCGPLSTGSDARQQTVVLRTRRQRDHLWFRHVLFSTVVLRTRRTNCDLLPGVALLSVEEKEEKEEE